MTEPPAAGEPPAPVPVLPAETRTWLAGPGLARFLDAARARLERNGLRATGTLRLTAPVPEERTALSQLAGRAFTGADITVSLAALDTRLRASAAGLGLVDTLRALGPPLTDRRAVRAGAEARRTRIWAAAEAALDASPLAGEAWARQWYEALRRAGVPAEVEPTAATRTLRQAVHVLAVLLPPAGPHRGRTATEHRGRGELAAEVTGSAHGLDDGTWLARLVQRGIALAHGMEPPVDAAGRRALWRLAGVVPDEISSTVLVYGLRPEGDGWRERALRERAEHHAEAHLTLRDLRALTAPRQPTPPGPSRLYGPSPDGPSPRNGQPPYGTSSYEPSPYGPSPRNGPPPYGPPALSLPPGTLVRVCENPRVVEAAADARCALPLVCTSGSASTAVLTLLDALAATGCRFAYHGDFDWPGLALANRIIRRYGARPWRLLAGDYERLAARTGEQAVPRLPLSGPPVDADWDPELAPAMAARGVALHEEVTLDLLVRDLSRPD
ncbi:TIGR02679 domain-containing protein [Streptomyces paludis]|uniref:TIGR02679 domain-containing protein n=1 Tax=Streptomyces paludis TaxID=2282738 RepID=UPI001E34A5F6|nr:TIGR02679 domain-containing protein [Streptomyces paludis]